MLILVSAISDDAFLLHFNWLPNLITCHPFFPIPLNYEYVITLAAIALYPASHPRIHVLQHHQSLFLNELVSIIHCHRPHLLRYKQELKPVGDVPSTVDDFVNSFH